MTTHWIITNREVGKPRGSTKEVILDSKKEALPTFRVASFTPAPIGAADHASLAKRVEVVPDHGGYDSYEETRRAKSPASLKGSGRLFKSLYDQMASAPAHKGDTLFFIHGFQYSWPDALVHLQRLHEIYFAPPESPVAQILYFTWPSWGDLLRYKSDQQIAMPSGLLLGRLFGKAVQFYKDFFAHDGQRQRFCGRKIHLAAHSMGNQVLQEFMRGIQDYDFLRSNLFGEVLLLHADADWQALEPQFPLAELPDYCDRIHIYNHFSDDALAVSEVTKNNAKRLGKHGPRDLSLLPPRTIVVDCTSLGDRKPASAPLDTHFLKVAERVLKGTDVSVRERLLDHWGYLHRPEEVADIYQVLRGDSTSTMLRPRGTREHRGGPLYRLA